MIKKVAILVNGGDCSGLNAVIRAITKTAEEHERKVMENMKGNTKGCGWSDYYPFDIV